jgi:SSS family solute:Na+ symporter
MTPEHLQSLGLAVGLLFLMTLVATRRSRNLSEEDYLVGGRDVPAWPLSAAIAAGVIGGGVLLVYTEYAFKFGLAALFIIGGITVGTLLMVPVAKKFKSLADTQLFYSLPDLYHHFWGRRAGFLATCTVLPWTVGFIIMQLISAGEIIRSMTGIPYYVGVILAASTVASYLLVAGFRAVVITDIMQYCALLLLLVLVFIPAAAQVDLHSSFLAAASQSINWPDAIGFFVLGALNMIVSADMYQRFYAARSEGHAKRGFWIAAGLVLAAGVLLLVPPLYARSRIPTVEANQALFRTLNLLLPKWLLGFGLVGVLATVIACLDTMVFILGIAVGHDLRVRHLKKPIENRLRSTRVTIVVALVAGTILSILFTKLLAVGLALSMLGLVLAPSIVLTVFKKPPSRRAVEGGLILGLAATAILLCASLFQPSLLTPENTLVALAGAVLGTCIGGLFQ